MHAYMHTWMHMYMHTYMHAYMHTCQSLLAEVLPNAIEPAPVPEAHQGIGSLFIAPDIKQGLGG